MDAPKVTTVSEYSEPRKVSLFRNLKSNLDKVQQTENVQTNVSLPALVCERNKVDKLTHDEKVSRFKQQWAEDSLNCVDKQPMIETIDLFEDDDYEDEDDFDENKSDGFIEQFDEEKEQLFFETHRSSIISAFNLFFLDLNSPLDRICLKYGNALYNPYRTIQDAPFATLRERFKSLNFHHLTPIQSHLWPCIARGRSVCCVANNNTGKTCTYLVPILNDINEKLIANPDGDLKGPFLIIICSSFKRVNNVSNQVTKLRGDNQFPRIVTLDSFNEEREKISILNGSEVLISTPSPLLRLMESKVLIPLKQCIMLALDDGDRTLELHLVAMKNIFLKYLDGMKNSLNKEDHFEMALTVQTAIFAEKWTPCLKQFQITQFNPIILFGNYFEGTIASKINSRVTFIDREWQRERAFSDLLLSLIETREYIAISCSDFYEAKQVLHLIPKNTIDPVVIEEGTQFYEYASLIARWKERKNAVLIITDKTLNHIPQITCVRCLIHYTLPSSTKGDFSARFQLMTQNFLLNDSSSSCESHIILSPNNQRQFLQIYKYMKRSKQKIPQQMKTFKKSLPRELCNNYLAFGYCPLRKYFCLSRHSFKPTEKADESLPKEGQIKGSVTYVDTANEFYMTIDEYRDGSCENKEWKKIERQMTMDLMKQRLENLKNEDLGLVKEVSINELYAIVVRETVHRVKIIDDLGNELLESYQVYDEDKISSVLRVFHIDFGYFTQCKSRDLIKLPEELKRIPPLAHKVYLWGIKPLDNEIEWHDRSTRAFYEKVMGKSISSVIAWVRLQINGTFWVDTISAVTKLKHMKTNVISCKPITALVEEKMASRNYFKLPNFNDSRGTIALKWRLLSQKSIAQYAFLEESTTVFMSHFKSLNEFYVLRATHYECLIQLENDLNTSNSRRIQVKDITPGLICIALYEREGVYNRVRIEEVKNDGTVDVFFLDHGETLNIKQNCCFHIEEKFIIRLPFQAIKCKLSGVVGEIEPDKIYDHTRFPNEAFKSVLANKLGVESNVSIVRLYVAEKEDDSKVIYNLLSKWLIENENCSYSNDEEVKVDPTITMIKDASDENDDHMSEEEIEAANRMLAKCLGIEDYDVLKQNINGVNSVKPKVKSNAQKLMDKLKKLKKTSETVVKCEVESDDDEDQSNKVQIKGFANVPYKPGDFDYKFDDGSSALPYDPDDQETDEDDDDEIYDIENEADNII
ncbi:putative ATP-dependent RNA helicase TDRD12-like protein [Dinothrombium tinctorium]|uniref:RNA helicase n=1 Tax=Dinothrombium tinctorium TaxID=1965070 RepID=A0A443R3Y0_9ACAR|nr:putative ATP-dependent RNA helicase TDRD12-like protein [Dinothrombium tinctorium]